MAPLRYPNDVFRDGASGWSIPKRVEHNLAWREATLLRAEEDEEYREGLREALRKSPILFVNLLCWTQRFFEHDPVTGERRPVTTLRNAPLVTYPCQDRETVRTARAIRSAKSLWQLKTRDMGWTWIMLALLAHFLIFTDTFHGIMASRKEEEVWKEGDPKALFSKLIFLLDRIPPWLLPDDYSKGKLHVGNPANGASIDGESTNADIGRGNRGDVVWIDEAAAVDNLEAIELSVKHTGGCRIYTSTPRIGSYFNSLAEAEEFEKATMLYYEHPEKGEGRTPVRHPRYGDVMMTPWLERLIKEAETKENGEQDIRENVLAELMAGGASVFSPTLIARCRDTAKEHARTLPAVKGDLLFAERKSKQADMGGKKSSKQADATVEPEELYEADERLRLRNAHAVRWAESPRVGAWTLWCPLRRGSLGLRPPQDTVYVIAADPGDGRQGANSAIVVGDAGTGRQVAEFVSADYSSRDLGRIMVAAGIWFGGLKPPLLIWEDNGVGGNVTEIVGQRLRWPNCYRKEHRGKVTPERTRSLGWHSTGATKRVLLDEMADAMGQGKLVVMSESMLDEMSTFIVVRGDVCQAKRRDMQTSAREAHGDRTIGGALMNLGMLECPRALGNIDRTNNDLRTWGGRENARLREEAADRRRRDTAHYALG